MTKVFNKDNMLSLILIAVTGVAIAVTGVIFDQAFYRILPLFISLIVGMFQSSANRYASLIGGVNSILYTFTYIYLGLYALAAYAFLFSFPIQILTFIRWSKNSYKNSTQFRSLTAKQRTLVGVGMVVSFIILAVILHFLNSSYQFLDNLTTLVGILISFLTMFAFIEYTWLMLPSGILSIILNIATMQDHPEQITYLIFSIYSFICVSRGFVRVRKLYREQLDAKKAISDAAKTE